MRRAIVILTAVAAMLSAPAAPAADAPTILPDPGPCVWLTEYHATLDELGADKDLWSVNPPPGGAWGIAYVSGRVVPRVEVSPEVTCDKVADVVRHEWMHMQQWRMRGPGLDVDASMELVADCGSWLLGSDYTPYRERLMQYRDPCTDETLATAKRLIFAE